MKNLFIPFVLIFICISGYSQEFCDNAIDDDADGFIDLNDDECDCDVFPNITSSGDLCDADLVLTSSTESVDGTWQWFIDGVALVGETSESVEVDTYGTGTYSAVYFTDESCERSDYTVEELIEVSADFEFDPICLGETTEFNNTSEIGDGVTPSWSWNFGGDGTSTDENPTHEFTDAGTYAVELIVFNDVGCNDTIELNVIVDPYPEAHFEFVIEGVSSEDGLEGSCIANTVQFNDLSTIDAPGEITSWQWDFGDLETSTDENPTHEYEAEGSHIISHTVQSDNGCSSTFSLEILMYGIPIMDLIFHEPSCFGYADGSLTTFISGGSGAFNISITDEDNNLRNEFGSNTANWLGFGWYYITIDDVSSCDLIDSIFLDQPNEIVIDALITPEVDGSDGAIDISVTGGTPPYTYDWSIDGVDDFDDEEDLTDLSDDIYTIQVKDHRNCIATRSINLNNPLTVETDLFADLSVYPNPTKNVVTIEFDGSFAYQILSVSGDIILEGIGTDKELFSMENIAPGTYFLRVENNQGVEIVRLIKQ